jgi:hypothetical protein
MVWLAALTVNVLLVVEILPPLTPLDVVAVSVQPAPAPPAVSAENVATPEEFVFTDVVPPNVPQPVDVNAIVAPFTAVPAEFLYVTETVGSVEPNVPVVG